MKSFNLLLLLILTVSFSSCKKDKLEGDYNVFEGKWKWVGTSYATKNCTLCQQVSHYISTSDVSYTAEIEFTDKGRVIFYINNDVVAEEKFKVLRQDKYEGEVSMQLEVKTDKLSIDDELNTSTLATDSIYVTNFPITGYDDSKTTTSSTNYYVKL